jgi:hypothetical protein
MSRFDDMLDEIDAFVYTGDHIFDEKTRRKFRHFLNRWQRRALEVEEIVEDMKEEQEKEDAFTKKMRRN